MRETTHTQIIIEHNFDVKTIEQINILRDIRIDLAKVQLENIENTVNEMIARNIISSEEKTRYINEIQLELIKKIKELEKRRQEEYNKIYADEIEFFVNFAGIKNY